MKKALVLAGGQPQIELIKELSVAFNSLPEGDIKRANILNDIAVSIKKQPRAAFLF